MPGSQPKRTSTAGGNHKTRSSAKKEEKKQAEEKLTTHDIEQAKSVGHMATGEDTPALSDLYTILVRLDNKVTGGFDEMKASLLKVTEKFDAIEMDLENVKAEQENDRADIEQLETKWETVLLLKQSLLVSQVYSRKYYILIYGLEGHETNTEEAIARVREFAKEKLNMEEEYVENLTIRNAHRLKKKANSTAPAAMIVVFVYWDERQTFLRAGIELRGTKMSIRTDLPPALKVKRGQLAEEAYRLRNVKDGRQIQARMREKVTDIWIETRRRESDHWKRMW